MDLWIRSQDSECLMIINTFVIPEDDKNSILGYGVDGKIKLVLGTYETKERALEVLDEIRETICLDKFNYDDKYKSCYQDCYRYKSDIIAIYDMPEK